MKQYLLGLTILASATFAHSASLKCTLSVDGETKSSESESAQASVSVKGFFCSGSTNGEYTVVHLYEPGETDDDDATKSHALDSKPAAVNRDDSQCSCEIVD